MMVGEGDRWIVTVRKREIVMYRVRQTVVERG